MLQLNQITKTYGKQVVVQPTTFDVPRGTSLVLIGPSGCGKSTLLRLMMGLIRPDSGTVHLDGVQITPANELAMRHKMGYVIQDGGLFPHLSGRDNVALMAKFLKWDEAKIKTRVQELADLVRLPQVALDKFPLQLSGGQRQRLGIMRAFMLDPPLILLDEPMGALDPLVRYDLQEEVRQIFRTLKKTVVMVTHDMGEAGFFGDQVMLLGEGRIVQQGTLDELIRSPKSDYVSRFIHAQRLPVTA